MGKNRLMQLRRRTPFELRRDRRVADQRAVLHAYHGPPDRGAVANIDIDAAERGRRVRKLCDVGQIKERSRLDGNPVADSRRPYGMLNAIRLEVHPANFHCLHQRYDAAIANREAHQQALRLASGVDRAWCALGKPSGMIEVGMREHDCSRRNSAQPAKPNRS